MSAAGALDRLRGGEAGAEAALAEAYLPAVRALALAETLDLEGAAEVARAAFPALVREAREAASPARVLGIAGEAVRDAGRDWQRDRGGRRSPLHALAGGSAPGGVPRLAATFEGVDDDDLPWMVLQAAARLPVQARALLLLRYLEGLDHAGIADLAGLRPREVGTGLTAARRLLAREIHAHLGKAGGP